MTIKKQRVEDEFLPGQLTKLKIDVDEAMKKAKTKKEREAIASITEALEEVGFKIR